MSTGRTVASDTGPPTGVPDPILSFVIPVRNDAASLERCLKSIRGSLRGMTAEIIVADNGSTDASADVARSLGASVLSVPGHRVGEVRNLAAAMARGELLAFIDADHQIGAGWVPAAIEVMQDASASAAGAPYHAPPHATWVQVMYDRLRTRADGVQPVEWLGSGNLVVRRTVFESVGGFDTSLESCEDVDFCQRLIAQGGRILGVDAMVSTHYGDPRTLRALFLGELWRGRDNVRVSLRGPLNLRSVPGLAIPLLLLAALLAAVCGIIGLPWGGLWLIAASAPLAVLLMLPHAWLLVRRTPRSELTTADVGRALVFSAVYNTARAVALVSRAGHRTRRAG